MKLQTARTAIEQAFKAISSAEKAGANVTSLIDQLNGAANLLAKAENAYHAGDMNTAAINAEAVLPIASQAIASAQTAQEAATIANQNNFWITITFATIGSCVFVLVLFMVWRWFKRRYTNNLATAKPEVTQE